MQDFDLRRAMIEIISRNRTLFIWESIAFIILGVLAIMSPVLFSIAIELLIGWICIISAIVIAVRLAQGKQLPNTSSMVMSLILYLLLGIVLVAYPLSGVLTLNLLLACFFFCDGIFRLTSAIQMRPAPRWGWIFFSGFLSFLLGLLIVMTWPQGAPWILGMLLGINLLSNGCIQLGLVMALPKAK